MKFKKVNWLRYVMVVSGTTSPPMKKSSVNSPVAIAVRSGLDLKSCKNQPVVVLAPLLLRTLQVSVETFCVPSKLATNEPLGGLARSTAPRPKQDNN